MRKINFCLSIIVLLLSACTKDKVLEPTSIDEAPVVEAQQTSVSPEIIEKLNLLSYNPEGVKLVKIKVDSVTTEDNYLVEGDILIKKDYLESLDLAKKGGLTSHYHTNNLISIPSGTRIIKVHALFTLWGGSNPEILLFRQLQALSQALTEFNDLGLSIEFRLTFDTSTTSQDFLNKDIYVRQTSTEAPSGGGVAGSPSGGNPGSYVYFDRGTSSYTVNQLKHIAMHELGHAVGLRHTDWQYKESCGGGSSDSTSPGVNYIPGTATGNDPTSVMQSCGFTTNGSFNNNDKTALRYVY